MPDTIRTYDLQFRKLTLYPAELRAHKLLITTLVILAYFPLFYNLVGVT